MIAASNRGGRSMMAHGMDVKADGPAKRKADETGSTGTKRVRLQNAGGETSSAAYYQRLSRYVCILGLPAEVWQRVFTFCHPRTLASCMLISKPFRFCLTEVRDEASAAARVPSKGLKMMPSDEVWRASRYLYHSSMPRKNLCQTELATWRLLRGNKCQFCGYTTLGKTPDRRGNEAGPGKDQVGIVWPFAVRCCGQCINSKTQPEAELLFSSLSFMAAAIPFIFLTSNLNVISQANVRNGKIPLDTQVSKRFWRPAIEQYTAEFLRMQQIGGAAAEKWYKDIEKGYSGKMTTASQWEDWSLGGSLRNIDTAFSQQNGRMSYNSGTPKQHGPIVKRRLDIESSQILAQPRPQKPAETKKIDLLQRVNTRTENSDQSSAGSHEGSMRKASKAKAARQAEIESRCRLLDPPILPEVLWQMDAFQAAIKIPHPLNDAAWEYLKVKLLRQREPAELLSFVSQKISAVMPESQADPRLPNIHIKEARSTTDLDWDQAQKSIREHVARIAKEYIYNTWGDGNHVNGDNCPSFAAFTLINTRKKYYESLHLAGTQPPNKSSKASSYSQQSISPLRLTLDCMRWLFDSVIKPVAEPFRKELFLCHTCGTSTKFFGFEGVIQHYGAKHTTSYTRGSVVVSWHDVEWPEEPPFHPKPAMLTNMGRQIQTPFSPASQVQYVYPPYSPYPYGPNSRGATVTPSSGPLVGFSYQQTSPAPYATQVYRQNFHGPYAPPPLPPPFPSAGNTGVSSNAYPVSFQHQQHQKAQFEGFYVFPGQGVPNNSAVTPQVALSYNLSGFGTNSVDKPLALPGTTSIAEEIDESEASANDASGATNGGGDVVAISEELHKDHINQIGSSSEALLRLMAGVKGLSQNVKLYVIIYHLVFKFKERFGDEPSLGLFMHALTHNMAMRPVKSLNNFSCSLCSSSCGATAVARPSSSVDASEHFSISGLISHFLSVHTTPEDSPSIEGSLSGTAKKSLASFLKVLDIPADFDISQWALVPGVTEERYRLLKDALPSDDHRSPAERDKAEEDLDEPHATNGAVPAGPSKNPPGLVSQADQEITVAHSEQAASIPQAKDPGETTLLKPRRSPLPTASVPVSRGSSRPVSGFREDEYDPRRPAIYLKDREKLSRQEDGYVKVPHPAQDGYFYERIELVDDSPRQNVYLRNPEYDYEPLAPPEAAYARAVDLPYRFAEPYYEDNYIRDEGYSHRIPRMPVYHGPERLSPIFVREQDVGVSYPGYNQDGTNSVAYRDRHVAGEREKDSRGASVERQPSVTTKADLVSGESESRKVHESAEQSQATGKEARHASSKAAESDQPQPKLDLSEGGSRAAGEDASQTRSQGRSVDARTSEAHEGPISRNADVWRMGASESEQRRPSQRYGQSVRRQPAYYAYHPPPHHAPAPGPPPSLPLHHHHASRLASSNYARYEQAARLTAREGTVPAGGRYSRYYAVSRRLDQSDVHPTDGRPSAGTPELQGPSPRIRTPLDPGHAERAKSPPRPMPGRGQFGEMEAGYANEWARPPGVAYMLHPTDDRSYDNRPLGYVRMPEARDYIERQPPRERDYVVVGPSWRPEPGRMVYSERAGEYRDRGLAPPSTYSSASGSRAASRPQEPAAER